MSAQDISKIWRKQIIQKSALAALPILAAVAQATKSIDLIVAFAVIIPVLILSGNILVLAPKTDKRSERRGASALKQHLQQQLDASLDTQRSACILLELEQQALIEREWGTSTLELAHGEIAARVGVMMRRTDNVFLLDRGLIGLCIDDIRAPELNSVISLIERLQAGIAQPIALDGAEIYVSAAAGFCIDARAPIKTAEAIFDAAHLALAEAKRAGPRCCARILKTDANGRARPRQTCNQMSSTPWNQVTLSRGFNLKSRPTPDKSQGLKRLARWKHPDHGMMPPSDFIPLLERAGRMEDLSEAILNHALQAVESMGQGRVRCAKRVGQFRNPGTTQSGSCRTDQMGRGPV